MVTGSDEEARVDAVFIALARNAFDVQMRREWWPVPARNGQWIVRSPDNALDVMEGPPERDFQTWPDPFTALVEADRWYRENVEVDRSIADV
jgi:hypothetical protein